MSMAPSKDLNTIRVDQVGSLVVPPTVVDASERRLRGELSASDLRAIEDGAIRDVIRKQEQVGLPILTDGEFRRRNFQDSFGNAVSGYDAPAMTGKDFRDPALWRAAVERLKLRKNVVLDEYKAAAAMTERPVKVSLIGPDRIAQRFAWERSQAVYKDIDDFISDVVAIQRQMIRELVDAGCRYVHMDAPGFTAYVDKVSRERMRARGEDPEENLDRAIRAENAVIEGFPGVTFGLHVCRGNPRGVDAQGKVQAQWHREGRYDSIAEKLFSGLKHQRLLLEYDTERAGTFEPLRFVRKGTVAVLGVVTTKSEEVETVDSMRRKVEAASKYLPVEQLAVSPQCGFSSGVGVPQLSEQVEWRKFEVLLRTAEAVWGHA
jgi:5-methyltetrahydropteroyltriglutamate--homocysteine methyltransferase